MQRWVGTLKPDWFLVNNETNLELPETQEDSGRKIYPPVWKKKAYCSKWSGPAGGLYKIQTDSTAIVDQCEKTYFQAVKVLVKQLYRRHSWTLKSNCTGNIWQATELQCWKSTNKLNGSIKPAVKGHNERQQHHGDTKFTKAWSLKPYRHAEKLCNMKDESESNTSASNLDTSSLSHQMNNFEWDWR